MIPISPALFLAIISSARSIPPPHKLKTSAPAKTSPRSTKEMPLVLVKAKTSLRSTNTAFLCRGGKSSHGPKPLQQVHQGLSFGTLRDMEDTVAEVSRINETLFNTIKSKTKVTEEQLNEVLQKKKDWFLTAEDALKLGILTDLL